MSEIKYLDKEGLQYLVGELDKKYQEKLTPGYGIEIQDDNTIDSEVKYIHQDEEWKEQSWNGLNSFIGCHVWKDYDEIIHYDDNSAHYYLDSDNKTWIVQTWNGYTKSSFYGQYIWKDYNGVIHWDYNSNHYYLDSDNKTWIVQTWNGYTGITDSRTIWKDYNGVIHYDHDSDHYYLDNSDNKTWKQLTWNGYSPINGADIWTDNNGIIHYDNSAIHYFLDSDNKTWIVQTWNGYTPTYGIRIWKDNNGVIHHDNNNSHYYLDSDGVTWKVYTWNGHISNIDNTYIWKDNNGVFHHDNAVYHDYLEESKSLYLTKHNDELLTKLTAGNNITISNGIISAIGGDLNNYYNKTEVDNKISTIPKFSISVVSTLPTTEISATTVYLVANTTSQTQNLYTEYIYVNSTWEKLGEQAFDLSGYATIEDLNEKQDSLTATQLNAVNSGITSTKVATYDEYATNIENKVDKVSGKGLSTNDYTTTEKNKLASIAENANNYSHPTYTSKTNGLYKITVDDTGHISGTSAVTASDLPAHSHTDYITSETDPVFSISAAAGITSEDIANWNAKGTSNLTIGTTSTTAAAGNHTHSNYAVNKTLTNENLNNVTTPGFYNAGGSNSCTNTKTAGNAFGLEVIHNATGSYYTQILHDYKGKDYRRYCNNGTWSEWDEIKYTETDPVFSASAAADIKSTDITNWNNKTSNTGTVTSVSVTMNGENKGTVTESGTIDLGTVLTSHQSLSSYLKVSGSNGTAAGVSALLNKLSAVSSNPGDDDYYISQYTNGGTTTTTYHRRPISKLWNYVKGKADKIYAPYANRVKRCTITKDSNTAVKWSRFGYINVPKSDGNRNYECTLLITGNWGNDNVFTANGVYKFGFKTNSSGNIEGNWCGWQSKYTYAEGILNDDWIKVYQGSDWQNSDGNTLFTIELWLGLGPVSSSFNITVLSEGYRSSNHTGSINLESKTAEYGTPSGTLWTANITPQYLSLTGGTLTGDLILNSSGAIALGNTKAVTGGTVYNYCKDVIKDVYLNGASVVKEVSGDKRAEIYAVPNISYLCTKTGSVGSLECICETTILSTFSRTLHFFVKNNLDAKLCGNLTVVWDGSKFTLSTDNVHLQAYICVECYDGLGYLYGIVYSQGVKWSVQTLDNGKLFVNDGSFTETLSNVNAVWANCYSSTTKFHICFRTKVYVGGHTISEMCSVSMAPEYSKVPLDWSVVSSRYFMSGSSRLLELTISSTHRQGNYADLKIGLSMSVMYNNTSGIKASLNDFDININANVFTITINTDSIVYNGGFDGYITIHMQ